MNYDAVFITGVCHPISFNRAQGAYRLAHVLRQHSYNVRIIDGIGTLPIENICDMIRLVVSKNTKLFGISTSFFSNFKSSVHADSLVTTDFLPYPYEDWMKMISLVKKLSNAKIIVGGHKTNEFEQAKKNHTYIDKFVYGYSDDIIVSLLSEESKVKIINNRTNTISSNSFNAFDTLYDPLDSFLPGEAFTVEMQRGCMFKCTFCAYPMNGKMKNSFRRNPKLIVDELSFCHGNFQSTNFILNSDTFNDSQEYLIAFLNELEKRNKKFNFAINARADLFYKNDDLIKICKDIGVRTVLFGLETSNPFSLKHIKKGLEYDKIVETLYKCKEIWKNNIKVTGSYIIGLPFDTLENIQRVKDFFMSNDCPLDSIELDPLYVFNKNLDKNIWQSEYSKNPEIFGFTFENDSLLNWTNKNCVFDSFDKSVSYVKTFLSSLPNNKKNTIKSAAYMHLPVNVPISATSGEKFEEIFKFTTYGEYRNYLNNLGHTYESAKMLASLKYFELFIRNNSK